MKKGFTLAELLAVIIILGVIAAIAVPSVNQYIEASKDSSYNTSVKTIITATKEWYSKYGVDEWISTATGYTYYLLPLSDLKKTEFLSNEDMIDPRTNQLMNGCILIVEESNNSNSYKYLDICE